MGIRYRPELDGLRALAVLAVVVYHARIPGLNGGWIGVDVFFVLSGYLITRILAENPDLPRFYWRRIKRLVPALSFMLATYLLVFPVIAPDHPHVRDAALAFFYLTDYSAPLLKAPDYLRHTWSLSVEEHFYLLWPLIFLRFRPSFPVLVGAWVAMTWWRLHVGGLHGYTRFDTHCTGLILGCICAGLPRGNFRAWPAVLALGLLCVLYVFKSPLAHNEGLIAVELLAAAALMGQPPKWVSTDTLVYIGRLSYGIYLWHFPLAWWMHEKGMEPMFVLSASALFGVGMAALSYHTIEAVFRKNRVTPSYIPGSYQPLP